MYFSFEHKSFQEQEVNPAKKAVLGSDLTLSWEEFRVEVEKLLSLLHELQVPKGHPVIIYGHKEAHFIVAKTALLIYGAPYVPADLVFPYERVHMMQEESGSELLLNCTQDQSLHTFFPVVIELPEGRIGKNEKPITASLAHLATEENPISYILFTSGSTGRPKGVPITEKGVIDFARWLQSSFGIASSDVILNVSALSFDFASFEEYLFLGLGLTLVLTTTEELKSSDRLLEKILGEKATVWVSTPSLVYMYLMEPRFNAQDLPSLKHFVFAGEALPLQTVKRLMERFPQAKIWNAYGPTEATNLTTSVLLTAEILEKYQAVPIGFPKPGSEVFLSGTDDEGTGELCIAGDHVSIGYLNNELLNRDKFFVHGGKRAYRSGDLAFQQDGMLFYAGRNDDMVKLHGYRIEPDDISSALRNLQGIDNAATIGLKHKGETKKIVSFYCAQRQMDSAELLLKLKIALPEYMIPADLIRLAEIPLNTSGKVDQKRLQEMYIKRDFA
ncbi:MAG: AMP-binding protein [Bacteroidota bacterium]